MQVLIVDPEEAPSYPERSSALARHNSSIDGVGSRATPATSQRQLLLPSASPTHEDSNYLTQQPSVTVHSIGVVILRHPPSHPSQPPRHTSEFRRHCPTRMNFAGDVTNFERAAEMFSDAQAAGLVNDDVATDDQSLRRGVSVMLVRASPAPARPSPHTGT